MPIASIPVALFEAIFAKSYSTWFPLISGMENCVDSSSIRSLTKFCRRCLVRSCPFSSIHEMGVVDVCDSIKYSLNAFAMAVGSDI